jgi:hypothetical protein
MVTDGRRSRTLAFSVALARRGPGLAFHCSDNREARPDISVTIDQTVVDRLFAVT